MCGVFVIWVCVHVLCVLILRVQADQPISSAAVLSPSAPGSGPCRALRLWRRPTAGPASAAAAARLRVPVQLHALRGGFQASLMGGLRWLTGSLGQNSALGDTPSGTSLPPPPSPHHHRTLCHVTGPVVFYFGLCGGTLLADRLAESPRWLTCNLHPSALTGQSMILSPGIKSGLAMPFVCNLPSSEQRGTFSSTTCQFLRYTV